MIMIKFDYLNFYILIPSIIFFYYLFEGYFSLNNIKNFYKFLINFLWEHRSIATGFKIMGLVLFVGLLFYLNQGEAYAMAPEGSDLPKPEVKVTTGDVSNSVNIKDSNINIPNVVATGLTNLGTGAAVAAGIKGGASIAKATGVSPAVKLGIMGAGAIIGGVSVVVANATGSLTQKKIDNAVTSAVKSNPTLPTSPAQTNATTTSEATNPGSGDVPTAFSIEPGADLDTVMSLLDANHILHTCTLYLSVALMILYVTTMVVEKNLNLIFIKNIFGEGFYNLLIKSLSFTAKYNRIWMFIGWVFLVFASLVALYISYYLLNNIDIISEIVQQSKSK